MIYFACQVVYVFFGLLAYIRFQNNLLVKMATCPSNIFVHSSGTSSPASFKSLRLPSSTSLRSFWSSSRLASSAFILTFRCDANSRQCSISYRPSFVRLGASGSKSHASKVRRVMPSICASSLLALANLPACLSEVFAFIFCPYFFFLLYVYTCKKFDGWTTDKPDAAVEKSLRQYDRPLAMAPSRKVRCF